MKKITTPLTMDTIEDLKVGDEVYIYGKIYTMRDAAHKKITDMINKKEKLPFDLKNQVIYYCGPTTSSRMDKYTPLLLKQGLKGMIGKGERSVEVKEAIKKYKAVYFSALGGLGALYTDNIKKAKIIAFPELGPEAIYELEVEDFYAIVINDAEGNDFYVLNKYNWISQSGKILIC